MLNSMQDLKDKIIVRAKRQLESDFGTISAEKAILLEDYFDDAVSEIKKWRKLTLDDEFLNELYNYNITKYIIRVFQERGIEGQTNSNVGGESKSFKLTPNQELLTGIVQRV